jgi:ATP-dependent DNA helicase Q4
MDSVEARLVLVQKLLSKSTARCDLGKDSPVCDGCLANGNVIVYVWRQRDAEVVAETLVAAGVEGGVVVYHGGMDSAARTKAQSSFLRGKARVCVATVAFGLGVNKIDIDAVVHMNLPSSLEHYLQEIGRAGRDGRPARAVSLPITDEIILRHSLAHSDLISKSQVLLLLRTIQTQIDLVLSDLDLKSTMIATQEYRVYIPIRIHHAIEALDLKTETIETLLSLMEGDEISKSLFRFEGRTNDSVLIVLKRSTLKELEIREEVIRCIAKCGSACDLSKSEENQVGRASVALRKLASRSTGLGAIEFSVSRCTNLMGPSAEPRHVFAALRRLQSSGEIELMTDASGLAMQLQLKGTAITMFDELKHADSSGLAETIWLHFTNHIANTASKIRRIDSILRQVAAVKDKGILTEQGKSLRLKMFQELATETLAGGREFEGSHIDIEELPPKVSPGSFKELKYDAQSVLNLLCTGMTPNDGLERSNSIIFDHSDFMDYTALAVTKFLHGIDSKRTATFSRHHPLFAKWRQHEFTSVAACVEDCLKSQI